MKTSARYLKYVQWSEADGHYLGNCPDLFPYGAVCHDATDQGRLPRCAELSPKQ